mmetsp:Transcript_70655/g.165688  ORF Transcript_70655/g.165688 Transcript_70655/m.165688 type:complete len:332 (-) Transcript_70655:96-1091(-)
MEGSFALGVWSYQPGRCYQVWIDGMHRVIYEERQPDGREVRGALRFEEPWLVGRLTFTDTHDVLGTVRLCHAEESDSLISYFQPHGSSGWAQAVASRCIAKEEAPVQEEGLGMRSETEATETLAVLSKAGCQPSTDLTQDDGLSPILRDCVLHSLQARINYLEKNFSQPVDEEPTRVLERSWRRGSEHMASALGREKFELRVRQKQRRFARTVWQEQEAQARPKVLHADASLENGTKLPPGGTTATRAETKEQGVQCDVEASSPSHAGSVAPDVIQETGTWENPKRAAQLQAVLERQRRRCVVLAEDVALLSEELLKLQAKPLVAASLWMQ